MTESSLRTEYVVLRQEDLAEPGDGEHSAWVEAGRATAVNAQTAIKQVAQGEGTFVAVPARSWKPLTRKIEQVARDLWS